MPNVIRDDPPFFINETRVGLDIDGVICNFHDGIIQIARARGMRGDFPEKWQWITSWHFSEKFAALFAELAIEPKFWLSLHPYEGVQETIDFEVEAYVTARPTKSGTTLQWLNAHGFPAGHVFTVADSKVRALQELNIDVFVDDKPENFAEINAAGITCFLMDRPWNRHVDTGGWLHEGGMRISNLAQLGAWLRVIESEPQECDCEPTLPSGITDPPLVTDPVFTDT